MSKGQKKALAVVGGAASIAAGYTAYRKAKKWEWGSAASIVSGVAMIAGALFG
jgi:hypothetical protein